MKKLLALLFVTLFLLFGSYNSMANVQDGPIVGGFGTFQDQNTGRIWLYMASFSNMSTTDMVAAASVAGFTFATEGDVSQLLNSLPLTGGEWSSYADIMGRAPNRDLIWGSYYMSATTYGWAYAYNGDTSWTISPVNTPWTFIENADTPNADMNIWAYQSGNTSVPEPTTMLLLGLGLVGIAGVKRKFKQ
jgi:hypothetical protein